MGRVPILRVRSSSASAFTVCARCHRSFASSPVLYSGHNRWSKIRHEKGAADKKKNAQRTQFSNQLTFSSKLYGSDPNLNSHLAATIAAAKKAGMPKANIDVAIARGQGKSSSGAELESVTLEVMMPPSVAMIIDVETENRQRALKDLRALVKKHNGTVTPTAFLFSRQGRTVFEIKSGGEFDDIMMHALEAGADDVDQDDQGNIVLWTHPSKTQEVAQNMSSASSIEVAVADSDILWKLVSDKVQLDDPEAARSLGELLTALREYPDLNAIYANVEQGAVPDDIWSVVEENLDS
ncbi:YebC-like protein [Xylariomycetidae sp. FL2044]|nr:YebC-like protein [Xylariomycetidae sp. FL2044]